MSKGPGRTQRNILRVLHAEPDDRRLSVREITWKVYPQLERMFRVHPAGSDAEYAAEKLRSTVTRALGGLWDAGLVTKWRATWTENHYEYPDDPPGEGNPGQHQAVRAKLWSLTDEGHARAAALGTDLDGPPPNALNWVLEPRRREPVEVDARIAEDARHFGEGG